jgi:hypothetical protein
MDDPKFRVGPIVWQALVNVLTKIVTAPFAALGRLFGDGEELAYIDFPAGSASLAPEQQEKLAKLAKAMSARPQLRLDITLQTLTPADDVALSNSAPEAELRPMLPSASGDAQPSKEERLAALVALYEQQMGAPPFYPMPEATDADVVGSNIAFLERELRQKISLTQAARESLARARARTRCSPPFSTIWRSSPSVCSAASANPAKRRWWVRRAWNSVLMMASWPQNQCW